jgi:hypothetical protein
MRFSKNVEHRHMEAREILRICQESRATRGSTYRNWNHTYFYGATSGIECKDNRIKPIVDQQSSFLYAPESVSFWTDLGPSALSNWVEVPVHVIDKISQSGTIDSIPQDKLEQILEQVNFDRIDSVIDSLNDSWHDTDIDIIASGGLTNALIEGAAIMQVHVEPHREERKNSIVAYQVAPEDFGVWREDQPFLQKQQAVSHTTTLSKPEILIRIYNNPKREQILNGLETASNEGISTSRVFPTSATSTSVTGAPLGVFT